MPPEEMWASFFNAEQIFTELEINSEVSDIVEIGCGYGTFTIPAARMVKGKLYGFDIEQEMVEKVQEKQNNEHIGNIILRKRDVLADTTGLADTSVDYVMLFNILHNDSPDDFLTEAFRILKSNGKVGILHWRSDIVTPRGPDLSIRPKPEQIIARINRQMFKVSKGPVLIDPFHFGIVLSKL